MIETANRHGYTGATVSAVIAQAGVSRPTFYEHFRDRDACFQAGIEHAQAQLMQRVAPALASSPPQCALAGVVETLIGYATEEPAAARFLTAESMAGGASALELRDHALAQAAAAVAKAQQGTPAQAALPDVDPRVVIGTLCRLLAIRLRRGEPALSTLSEELLAWLGAFERPEGERRWQILTPATTPARTPAVPAFAFEQAPEALPPGRPRLPVQEIAENHRLRILNAAATLAMQKGYLATTITDITKLARIDGAVFYRHFADKEEAFSAVHELGFQHVLDVTAKAFFAEADWPRRSWEALRAFTELLQENPLVAHVAFVEAHTLGPSAVQRIEDSQLAFMFFLQEGLLQQAQPPLTSRVAMEATIATAFEVLYITIRRPGSSQLSGMLAPIAHWWLTPFLGLEQADSFIDAQITAEAGS